GMGLAVGLASYEAETGVHSWRSVDGPTARYLRFEARSGGAFTTVMVNDADGSTYPTSARYLEVSEPERLSWIEDHSGMTVTATFTDLGDDGTQVDIEQTNVPAQLMDPAAQAGFLTSLDRFAAHLARRTRAER